MNPKATRGLALPLLLAVALPSTTLPAAAQTFTTERHAVRATVVLEGLSQPWGMAWLPDGRLLITEKRGTLRLVENGRLRPAPVAGLPQVTPHGQGGLLDVALHPDYAKNGWIYWSYNAENDDGHGTEVARGRLTPDGARMTDVQVVFRMAPKSGAGRHFGSRLVFDRRNFLYITLGDRGDDTGKGHEQRAQSLGDHAGSVIRLHDDGRVPADNPFVGQAGARPEIFSYGHRNMQGAALHPASGRLWTHEHGPQGGDEVNVETAGANYGWPVVTQGVNYVIGTRIGEGSSKPGMVDPLHVWAPSIAPSGMAFYTGDRFPQWRGSLFVGALKAQLVARLTLAGEKVVGEERLFEGAFGRIRDVRQGPDGFLYLLTDAGNGRLIRLELAD
jgi:glucose/arabinose dehydrogenase